MLWVLWFETFTEWHTLWLCCIFWPKCFKIWYCTASLNIFKSCSLIYLGKGVLRCGKCKVFVAHKGSSWKSPSRDQCLRLASHTEERKRPPGSSLPHLFHTETSSRYNWDATMLSWEQTLLCEVRTLQSKLGKHKIYLCLFLSIQLCQCSLANKLPLRHLNNLLII